MTRQKQILTILIGIFLLSLAYAWQRYPRQKTAPPLSTTTVKAALQQQSSTVRNTAAPPQRETTFTQDHHQVVVHRDLFRPLDYPTAESAQKRATVQVETRPTPPPSIQLPAPPPPTPEELARNEARQYRLMGFLKQDKRQTAFVAKGERITLVREGDSLIAGYTVSKVNNYRIVMRAENGDEITITGR